MRKITCAWTQKNVDRVHNRFNLISDWKVCFTSKLGNGYKVVDTKNNRFTFIFTELPKKAVQ